MDLNRILGICSKSSLFKGFSFKNWWFWWIWAKLVILTVGSHPRGVVGTQTHSARKFTFVDFQKITGKLRSIAKKLQNTCNKFTENAQKIIMYVQWWGGGTSGEGVHFLTEGATDTSRDCANSLLISALKFLTPQIPGSQKLKSWAPFFAPSLRIRSTSR